MGTLNFISLFHARYKIKKTSFSFMRERKIHHLSYSFNMHVLTSNNNLKIAFGNISCFICYSKGYSVLAPSEFASIRSAR